MPAMFIDCMMTLNFDKLLSTIIYQNQCNVAQPFESSTVNIMRML